ncbi:hypothetical protein MsAm2_09790 [Methanolapillus ohkumae]|uniref:Phenylacetate--CoA ligase family protein n=2 Tax=Methanolapillus ohkumae TaxID=3028298 RepID=A0AA97A6B9_9EURY|nr:hypothetical protein MsAm2_09790 [Methanosarcinaceae archaeon Am2]
MTRFDMAHRAYCMTIYKMHDLAACFLFVLFDNKHLFYLTTNNYFYSNSGYDEFMAFWDPQIETMNRKEMNDLQLKRLTKSVQTVYRNVPFYKKKFDAVGVKPQDIRSLSDISKLPMLTKQDFTDNYPYGLFAAPMEDIIRIHSSSGTTGKPKVVGYT